MTYSPTSSWWPTITPYPTISPWPSVTAYPTPTDWLTTSPYPTNTAEPTPVDWLYTPNPSSPNITVGHFKDMTYPKKFIGPCRTPDPNITYWCPVSRYCEFDFFDTSMQHFLSNSLGYSRTRWNFYRINSIEEQYFSGLDITIQKSLESIGFTEDKHDCCQNHYTSYDWEDFDPEYGFGEVLDAWVKLGYDEELWASGGASMYDEYDWDELPQDVQLSISSALCYTRETWDGEPLTEWPEDVTLPGSKEIMTSLSPTSQPTEYPSSQKSHFPSQRFTNYPTEIRSSNHPSVRQSMLPSIYTSSPSFFPTFYTTTGNPTRSLTLLPSPKPSELGSMNPTLSPTYFSSQEPSGQITGQPQMSTPSPSKLFTLFPTALNPKITQSSHPTVASVNYPSKTPSPTESLDQFQPTFIPSPSISSQYNKYTSRPTFQTREEADTHRLTLSPTKTRTYYPTWTDLTSMDAAHVSIKSEFCRILDPNITYWCPVSRYCEFDFFDTPMQHFLSNSLGYSRTRWNFNGINPIEEQYFSGLDITIQKSLESIGFTEDKHDCCQNHYTSYDWEDFDPENGFGEVLDAWVKLGYDEELWASGGASMYDEYDWDELPQDVQLSISSALCYTRETWNGEPLTEWPEDVTLPGSYITNSEYRDQSVLPVADLEIISEYSRACGTGTEVSSVSIGSEDGLMRAETEVIFTFAAEIKKESFDFLPPLEMAIVNLVADMLLDCSVESEVRRLNGMNSTKNVTLSETYHDYKVIEVSFPGTNVLSNTSPCIPSQENVTACKVVSSRLIVVTEDNVTHEEQLISMVLNKIQSAMNAGNITSNEFDVPVHADIVFLRYLGPNPSLPYTPWKDLDTISDYQPSGSSDKSYINGLDLTLWTLIPLCVIIVLLGIFAIRYQLKKRDEIEQVCDNTGSDSSLVAASEEDELQKLEAKEELETKKEEEIQPKEKEDSQKYDDLDDDEFDF